MSEEKKKPTKLLFDNYFISIRHAQQPSTSTYTTIRSGVY